MLTIQTRNTRRLVGLATLVLAVALVAARPYLPMLASALLLISFVALSSIWIHAYWRDIGEVARDAQKTAWLWGGVYGAAVAIILMTIPAVFPFIDAIIDWIDASPDFLNPSFVAGVLWMFAAQMIGFTIYWLYWWIARR